MTSFESRSSHQVTLFTDAARAFRNGSVLNNMVDFRNFTEGLSAWVSAYTNSKNLPLLTFTSYLYVCLFQEVVERRHTHTHT
jgi:hypothetical protein